jgi:3-oxoacyl-[acyl-carrier-protein] synthase II
MISADRSRRRVLITGVGVVSPIGSTKERVWTALASGQSGIAPLVGLPADYLPTSFAGEVRDFTGAIDDFGPLEGEQKKAVRKGVKLMSRECQMGVAAALRACFDAGLRPGGFDPDRAGTVFGADYMLSAPQEFSAGIDLCAGTERRFNFDRWGDEGMGKMNPLWLLKYLPNMPACHVAIYMDLRGPSNTITQREAAANLAVDEAFHTIVRGAADLMVAGATGTRVHLMKSLHALQQEEIAGNGAHPAEASRPFDFHRTGMVLGEGAGAIILEEYGHAIARGAPIYGEVLAGGSSVAVSPNLVARRDLAIQNAIRRTFVAAALNAPRLGHIHAHGLGTRSCDPQEAQAIRRVLGDLASRTPVTAAKSYFGNLGAGGGMVELIVSLLSLGQGQLPRILNYQTPDPDCPIRAATGSDSAGDSFLNISVTPQGQASCVLVSAAR